MLTHTSHTKSARGPPAVKTGVKNTLRTVKQILPEWGDKPAVEVGAQRTAQHTRLHVHRVQRAGEKGLYKLEESLMHE